MPRTSKIIQEAMKYTFVVPSPAMFRERDRLHSMILVQSARRKLQLALKKLLPLDQREAEIVLLNQTQEILNRIRNRVEKN